MPDRPRDEEIFEKLAKAAKSAPQRRMRAPARLKSRIYSALVERAAAEGELRSLPETKAAGRGLCVFEELMRAAPLGKKLKKVNICRVCHARVLAEALENPPIYWANCPYAEFKKP
jgi:hypothetical protein